MREERALLPPNPYNMKTSKALRAGYEKFDRTKAYSPKEAAKLMVDTKRTKFDGTAEVHFTLGIDPRHADQQIRSTTSLPHGTGKTVNVIAICGDDQEKAAKAAGASTAGGQELIDKIAQGWTDFDAVVATPDMMKGLAKAARILGPKGMMPNPKTGTVTPNIDKVIKELVGGRLEFRNDKYGIIHTVFGKVSFGADKLAENLEAMIQTIKNAKPSGQKGVYMKKVTINATMGPGIMIDLGGEEEGK